ncbi:hypothetical protein LUZ60_001856 [Juncus effusus]|nr:hypothetical protein LUZ60_001856 [Juncus effusus]
MAYHFSPTILFLISLLAQTLVISTSSNYAPETLVHIHLYAHEIFTGQNATIVPVATIPTKEIDIVNIPLTKGPNPNSKLLGTAQGIIAVVSTQPTNTLYVSLNVIFTEGKYKDSTLAVSGRVEQAANGTTYYWSVVGGTKVLTWARGYVGAKVLSAQPGYKVVDMDIYLRVG